MKHLNLLLAAAFLSVSTILPAQGYLKGKILYFDNGISVTERGGSSFDFSLLGGLDTKSSVSLLSVERALEKAAEDPEIAMVFFRPDKMSASLSTCEEIRESLARFRQKGKPVVCYGVSFSNASYYLGSVADRVFMHPGSSGTLNGLSSNLLYYKDLLDTLGVEVQLIRHGSYKSAGEPYIRSEISPENREQYEVLLSSIWNPVVGSIAASRGLEEEKVRQIVDGLELNDSQDWLDHGLVDGLKYRDEMQAYLSHLFGESELSVVKKVSMSDYVKKLKDNGVELESGTTATHNRVADASYQVGICLDYVSANLIAEGSPMMFHYTTEDVITMTSPVALIKGCANEENGKLLMDFILSKEGQEVLVANNLVSVRDDVEMQVDTSAIAAINMEVDYNDLGENLQTYLDTFNKIFDK